MNSGSVLYLASQSSRRRQLLQSLGIAYRPLDIEVDESRQGRESPAEMVARLAAAKARAGLDALVATKVAPGSLLLAADTLVDLDGQPIGKPSSVAEARGILAAFCGREHSILTGVAVVDVHRGTDSLRVEVSATDVVMREPAPGWIEHCATVPEALKCAGGYAVQGAAAPLVVSFSGCFYTVVGLPLALTIRLLNDFGFDTTPSPSA